jgi:hypothetical protein
MATAVIHGDYITYTFALKTETIAAFTLAGVFLCAALVSGVLLCRERRLREFADAVRDAAVERAAKTELLNEAGVRLRPGWYQASESREPLSPDTPGASGGRRTSGGAGFQRRQLRFEDPVQAAVAQMKRRSAQFVAQWRLMAKIYPRIVHERLRRRYFGRWLATAARGRLSTAARAQAIVSRHQRAPDRAGWVEELEMRRVPPSVPLTRPTSQARNVHEAPRTI